MFSSNKNERLNFVYQDSFMNTFSEIYNIKFRLFKFLTRYSTNLFLRGKDLISLAPQVSGIHEPLIKSLIDHFSEIGYADFLIDIGANIGLTSCQNGNKFKQVHMFEPNPYCCKILEVNSFIALKNTKYRIYNYGLGDKNKKCILTVPNNNWGGAFIKDDSNSYDENVLVSKDRFQSFTNSNYFTIDIEIHKTTDVLSKTFTELIENNMTRGVVKIDVEGYELTILKGIAGSIPLELKILIVFESWDCNFDMDTIVKSFKGRATPYKIVRKYPWKKNWPNMLKVLSLLLNPKITNRLVAKKTKDWSGDIILHID
jgi:FkbM family methyltransferase